MRAIVAVPPCLGCPDCAQELTRGWDLQNLAKIDKLLAKYPPAYKRSAVIPMLHIAQVRHLPGQVPPHIGRCGIALFGLPHMFRHPRSKTMAGFRWRP